MLLSLLPMLSLLSLYCWLCGIVRRNQKFVNPAVFVRNANDRDYCPVCVALDYSQLTCSLLGSGLLVSYRTLATQRERVL